MYETVGVVVPTYNCREYLADCLDSLLKQSHQPAQIVICDDASRDGTQEIAQQLQKEHPDLIDCVLHEKNLGIARNFNSGLKQVKTNYVSIVSGDDLWHPDKLKLEMDALRENAECRWAYSDSVLVDKEGTYIEPFRREHDGAEGQILFEVLTHEMTLRNWLIEKSLLDSIGLFDESLFIFEDWDFKIRLAAKALVKHVAHDSVFYRRHGKGISTSAGNIYFDSLLMVYKKHMPLIAILPKEKKSAIIKKHKKDMLIHIERFLYSTHDMKLSTKLKFLGYKANFSLTSR
jgi:glycosyltransferase involved in cell wall biosynthesis